MGWSTGSALFDEVINTLRACVEETNTRKKIYKKLINAFEEYDCDTLYECKGRDKVFDEVFDEMYPEE